MTIRPWTPPWDDGITWRTQLVSKNQTFLAVPLRFVTERVLRSYNENLEDDLILGYIKAATELCERETNSLITPASHRMYLSGFPSGHVVFPEGPVREVTSVAYFDGDGVSQDYGGSPPSWTLVPAGRYGKAVLQPADSDAFPYSWPTTFARRDAVTIDYLVGYATAAEVPELLKQGIALAVGELYKNPDLSNADGQSPNLLNLSRFWPRRW